MSVEDYNNMLPEEVRDIIKSLSDDTRKAVMIDLLMQPKGRTFTQLMGDLGIPQGTLNYHLKNLFENGLIKNEFMKVDNTREYSYYLASHMAETFFEKVLDFIEEPVKYRTIDIQRPVSSISETWDLANIPKEEIQMATIATRR